MADNLIHRRGLFVGASAGLIGLATPKLVRASYIAPAAQQMGRMVNAVVDFGVDNTGATNVSTALNAAAAAAVSHSRPLYIPNGTYEFGATGQLLVNGPIEIRGAGAANTIMRRNALFNGAIFQLQGSNTTVRDLSFLFTGAEPLVGVNPSCSPILAFGASGNISRIRLLDLRCSGGFYVGFTFVNVTDGWIDRCIAEGCVDRGHYADFGCNNLRFNECVTEGSVASVTGYTPSHNTFYGFNTNPSGTTVMTDITYNNCIARNVSAHGFSTAERCINTKFIGCQAVNVNDGTSHIAPGFLVQNANGFNGERGTFTNCAAIGCDIGFEINLSTESTLDGCRAYLSLTTGALITHSNNCQIIGGHFVTGLGTGISLATAIQCQVIEAQVLANGGFGIFEDAPSDRNLMTNNIVLTNTSGQISRNGTNQVSANNIVT